MMMLLEVVTLATAVISVATADDTYLHDTVDIERRAGVLKDNTWPNGVIPYAFRGFSRDFENKILEAMREIEHDVNGPGSPCIKFVPRTNQADYLDINHGKGCQSDVGNLHRGAQDMTLGTGCDFRGTILHELVHAIGFFHEHARPDRDNYININHDNVAQGRTNNFEILLNHIVNTYDLPYDFNSIMQYGPYYHALDKNIPVLTPKPGKATNLQMGLQNKLSSGDVLKIQRMYQCPEDSSHIVSPLVPVASCNFATDYCGMSVPFAHPVRWTRTSASTRHGPKYGHSTGTDPYLVTKGRHGVAKFTTDWFKKGSLCMGAHLYQLGPNSYLEIYAQGPHIPWQKIHSYRDHYQNEWSHVRLTINIPNALDFKVIFQAHVVAEPIAIDDLYFYQGVCD